jgi:ABC-type branched-subunit amino acid transport system substrate-binding protein
MKTVTTLRRLFHRRFVSLFFRDSGRGANPWLAGNAVFLMAALATVVCGQEGITSSQILLGQVCALSGPAKDLGQELRAGAEAYFAFFNSQGGVHGRKIKMTTLDDGYEPQRTIAATKRLLERDKVFALFGYVGTPTSAAAVLLTKPGKIPFIAPFTGAEFLRTPPTENIFNVRASYFQETELQVHELVDVLGKNSLAVFYQDDSYGKAGLGGVQKAMRQRTLEIAATGTYTRNTVDIQKGLEAILAANPDAVVLIGTYKACAAFIKAAKAVGSTSIFMNVSFVGSTALAHELGDDGEGVFITQVVPLPWDASLPVVKEYQANLRRNLPGAEFGFGSLEGYLDAKVLAQGLRIAGKNLTRASLISAMDGMRNYDLGGVTVGFGPQDHQGLDKVYLTVIENGAFKQVRSLRDAWTGKP